MAPPSLPCGEGLTCLDDSICYDPSDPCYGVFCGGADNGNCLVDEEGLPECVCFLGYNNDGFSHFCEPNAGAFEDPSANR